MSAYTHQPVMLEETVAAWISQPDGAYLDATFGRGGHSRVALTKIGHQGQLWVMDRDPAAVAEANLLAQTDQRITVVAKAFEHIAMIDGPKYQGILFDLGVSSPQLDEAERGFAFRYDGPLDMRMDPQHGQSASQWLQQVSQDELQKVLYEWGEEPHARVISEAIVQARAQGAKLATTGELSALVLKAVPRFEKRHHPATRTFQALRIQVNDEMGQIHRGVQAAVACLAAGGRLVVLSYHGLEHIWVKQAIAAYTEAQQGSVRLKRVGHAKRPTRNEVVTNRRARSALLRTWEKRAC